MHVCESIAETKGSSLITLRLAEMLDADSHFSANRSVINKHHQVNIYVITMAV